MRWFPAFVVASSWVSVAAASCNHLSVHFVGNSVSRGRAFALSTRRAGGTTPAIEHEKEVCGSGKTSPEGSHCELPHNVSFTWIWNVHDTLMQQTFLNDASDVLVFNVGAHYVFTNQSGYLSRVNEELEDLIKTINAARARQIWFFTSTRTCADYYGLKTTEMNSRIVDINSVMTREIQSRTRARVFDAWTELATCAVFDDHVHSAYYSIQHTDEWWVRACDLESLQVVTSKCHESTEWLHGSFKDVTVCSKRSCLKDLGEARDDTCSIDTNTGLETAVFIKYIIENYARLPETIAFVHGHETSWHQVQNTSLPRLIKTAKTNVTGYVSLNAKFIGALPPLHLSEIHTMWNSVVLGRRSTMQRP